MCVLCNTHMNSPMRSQYQSSPSPSSVQYSPQPMQIRSLSPNHLNSRNTSPQRRMSPSPEMDAYNDHYSTLLESHDTTRKPRVRMQKQTVPDTVDTSALLYNVDLATQQRLSAQLAGARRLADEQLKAREDAERAAQLAISDIEKYVLMVLVHSYD